VDSVNKVVASESNRLLEEMIHIICAAVEFYVYGAAKVTTTNRKQFQVHLNRTRQAPTILLNANGQSAKRQWVCKIYQVTPVKCKHFDKLFQHHK